jgi:RimJ/RimL family protein N-acetyltransferase
VSPSISVPGGALRDGAIELRPLSEAGAPAFVEAFQDPAIAEGAYHGQIVATQEAMQPYLKRNAERMEAGDAVLLGVWEANAERLSGQTMLFNFDWDDGTAELGFWVAPWARGRGLSQPALRLTVAFALDQLGIERLYGLTGVDNDAAQRAMEGAGLRREGILRGVIKDSTGRLDQVCFGILADDPRPVWTVSSA